LPATVERAVREFAESTFYSTTPASFGGQRFSISPKTTGIGDAVNVKSIYLLSREVIPHMQKAVRTIINTLRMGLTGGVKAAVYCASKGAVVLLTKAMAVDHGPQKIRVNCICPGDTDTACCAKKRSNSEKRTAAFLPKLQSVRWAMGTPRKLRRRVVSGQRCVFIRHGDGSRRRCGGLAGSV